MYAQGRIAKAAKAVGGIERSETGSDFHLRVVWGMAGDQQNFGEVIAVGRRRRRRG